MPLLVDSSFCLCLLDQQTYPKTLAGIRVMTPACTHLHPVLMHCFALCSIIPVWHRHVWLVYLVILNMCLIPPNHYTLLILEQFRCVYSLMTKTCPVETHTHSHTRLYTNIQYKLRMLKLTGETENGDHNIAFAFAGGD